MVRRALALLATLLVVAALTTTPAAAGGPTSVLLSAPPHVVAFGYDDPQYSQLQSLTQVTPRASDDRSHDSGPFIRASWLIHDMSVWRIDIIYPEAPGGPWIATSESLDGTAPMGKPVWHTGTDSLALTKLLSSFKLLTGLRNGEYYVGGPTTLDRSAPEPQPATQIATSAFTGWRWLLPGALLGALLTWAASRLLRQRRWDLVETD